MHIGSSNIRINKIIGVVVTCFLAANVYGQTVIVQPVKVTKENGRHLLKMEVWNCTNKDIDVPLADLPWGQYRLGLVLYPAGKLAGEPLKENVAVGDSPDTEIKISAKGSASGEVDLDSRFLGVGRYEAGKNLLIFWEYDLSLIQGGNSQFVGGMIPLDMESPRESGAKAGCK